MALATTLQVHTNKIRLFFETPAAGSYQVVQTTDLKNWHYLGTGITRGAAHVVVNIPMSDKQAFYFVNFIPREW